MSNIEIIRELKESGKLKPLIVAGLFPAKVLTYTEMFYHVDAQVKSGVKKDKAVLCTACTFNVSRATVYTAIKSLQ